jgi:hypothetical protein
LELAEKLAYAERTRAFVEVASDMRAYMEGLGLARGKGGDLLRIGRKLPELPVLREAMADERVAWTAAREVVKVATPETEARWVELAELWSGRELRGAVLQAEVGDEAPDVRKPAPNLPIVFRFEVSAEVAERVAKAIAVVRMAAPVLSESGPEKKVPTERFQQVIRVCPTCDSAHLAGTASGDPVVASEEIRAMANCDSQVVDLGPGAYGLMNKTVTVTVKRQVLDRDNYRCSIPGCSNRWHIDLHHVRPQKDGGPHAVANLTTVCSCCHGWIHRGYLHIESDGNGAFSFDWTLKSGPSSDPAPNSALLSLTQPMTSTIETPSPLHNVRSSKQRQTLANILRYLCRRLSPGGTNRWPKKAKNVTTASVVGSWMARRYSPSRE